MENIIDKSKEKIEAMFDEIAPTYDKLNHLFTLNMDIHWRKEIIEYLNKNNLKPKIVLDLASGTGDLTIQLLDLNPERIFAVDISKKMLDVQMEKIDDTRLTLIQADAKSLPFESNFFELVTIGFGVRNFENLEQSLIEIQRVIEPGGKLVVLEMFKSEGIFCKIFNLYFEKVMPFIGNKISKSKYAYNYLFNSVNKFHNVDDFKKICERNGFQFDYLKNNFLGVVNTLYFSSIN